MVGRIAIFEILFIGVGVYTIYLFIRFMHLGIKAFNKYLSDKGKSE